MLARYAYQSPTAFDPDEDYEMPTKDSLLLATSGREKKTKLSQRAHVAIVVDGDNLWFRRDLLADGFKGGLKAARRVVEHVRAQLPEDMEPEDRKAVIVRAFIICNRTDLERVLAEQGGLPANALAQFARGWAEAGGAWFRVLDAGQSKQAADSHVRAHLVDSVLDADCLHVYLGGLEDFGYANELAGLRKLGLLGKISLLQLPDYVLRSKVYKDYEERIFRWPDVLASQTEWDWPTPEAAGSKKTERPAKATGQVTNGDASKAEETAATATKATPAADQKPCVDFHLLDHCPRRRCRYSHEPLEPAALQRLRRAVKRQPCPYIARGLICDYGADCPYGH